jgi:fumarylacetoacetate (FAA) hydrolase
MKLLSYSQKPDQTPRPAILIDGHIVDIPLISVWFYKQKNITDFLTLPPTILMMLEDWERCFSLLQEINRKLREYSSNELYIDNKKIAFLEKEIFFHSPVVNPPSFRDFYAFEQHVKTARALRGLEMIPEWYEIPVFYFSNHHALIGHDNQLEYPSYTSELDYELEVACIIGKKGKNIPASESENYIAGYSIINDWSLRDVQRKEMKMNLGPAKGKDFATSIGPYLVTKDELKPFLKDKGFDIKMTAKRNGTVLSSGNFSNIYFSFSQMIERASQGVTIYPGDILGSGTMGTGCILELTPEKAGGWLKKGDVVEIEVEQLGLLRNKVV